jgi:hypothetical protein
MVEQRFSFGQMRPLNSITEAVIHLIAHEMHHAVDDHQPKRCHREYLANDFAITVLKKYRESKQEIWHDIFCARRKERLKECQSEQRTKNVIEFKRSPERKLEIATAKLIEWQRAVKKGAEQG